VGVSEGVRVTLGDAEGTGPMGHASVVVVALDPPTARHSPEMPSHVRLTLTVASCRHPKVMIDGAPYGACTTVSVSKLLLNDGIEHAEHTGNVPFQSPPPADAQGDVSGNAVELTDVQAPLQTRVVGAPQYPSEQAYTAPEGFPLADPYVMAGAATLLPAGGVGAVHGKHCR